MPHDVSKLLNSTPVMFRNRNYKQSKAQGHSRTAWEMITAGILCESNIDRWKTF